MSSRGPGRGERGAATLLVVGVSGFLLVLTLGLVSVAAAVGARRSADAAADLTALAGAAAMARGEDGCLAAGSVAEANHARVRVCRPEGEELYVEVAVSTAGLLGRGEVQLQGRARAGPGRTDDALLTG